MKRVVLCFLAVFALISIKSFASVALYNDSPFKLKAIAIGANGMNIGQKIVAPQDTEVINDSIGGSNPTGSDQPMSTNPTTPVTPYTVFWYCMDGTSYSTCQNVGAGATATPNTGEGNKYCKLPPTQDQQAQPPQ